MKEASVFFVSLCTVGILASMVLHHLLWKPLILCGIPFVVVGLVCSVMFFISPVENMVK